MIRVVVDDLAFFVADAVVRPATARLDPTTTAVRRLEQIGGAAFRAQAQVQHDLAVGAAVVTGTGGDLGAEFVIHAIIQSREEPVTPGGVTLAWRSALQRAQEWEFARLAVPPLGTGAGNLPIEDAAEIMLAVVAAHHATAPLPTDIAIVVESAEEQEIFVAALQRAGVGGA